MFRTVKRNIDWCGECKGKLYLGFFMTFLSHIFAALPLALAAYTVGSLIESQKSGAAFDTGWIWKSIVLQIVLVFFRFLFDYFRICFIVKWKLSTVFFHTFHDHRRIGIHLKKCFLSDT